MQRMNLKQFRHKFKAKPVNDDGHHYGSTLEFKYRKHLDLLQKCGQVLFYLRQVPFHLPGGTKYIADFLVFWINGEIDFIDVKGKETDVFKIKKREVEAIYPVEIKVIKRGDF